MRTRRQQAAVVASTMWIQTTNTDSDGSPVTTRLTPPFADEPIEFSANGRAQVTREVGEQLVAEYESIVRSDTADSDGDESDPDADSEPAADAADSDATDDADDDADTESSED